MLLRSKSCTKTGVPALLSGSPKKGFGKDAHGRVSRKGIRKERTLSCSSTRDRSKRDKIPARMKHVQRAGEVAHDLLKSHCCEVER